MEKSADAFRTISEVADWLGVPTHVLRFWESKFPQVKPVKRAGGRRYYRPADMALLAGIRVLLHDDGITIRGVQKILREHGVKHVSGLCDRSLGTDADTDTDTAQDTHALDAVQEDSSVVELLPASFENKQTPAPAPDAETPSEPLPLFPAAEAEVAEAAPPDPVPDAPAAAQRFALPGPSPQRATETHALLQRLSAQPGAFSAMGPAQAAEFAARLEALRARLAGPDPT